MTIPVRNGVSLTMFQEADVDRCVDLLQEQDVHRGLLLMPNPYRPADFYVWCKIVEAEKEQFGQPIQFAIRDSEGHLIGGCGAKDLSVGHKCEIGYWLGKPSWGRGVMTDVVEVLCDYLQREFQIVRITASVFDGNTASMRVLEKNGFTHEGRMRNYYRKNGRFIDGELFAKVW